jgi:hypothetical protein
MLMAKRAVDLLTDVPPRKNDESVLKIEGTSSSPNYAG